jgi:hypothetical protein
MFMLLRTGTGMAMQGYLPVAGERASPNICDQPPLRTVKVHPYQSPCRSRQCDFVRLGRSARIEGLQPLGKDGFVGHGAGRLGTSIKRLPVRLPIA